MTHFAQDEFHQGSSTFYTEDDYIYHERRVPPYETHLEIASGSQLPSAWSQPQFNDENWRYLEVQTASVSDLPLKPFDVDLQMGSQTWSDRSLSFVFSDRDDVTEALRTDDEAVRDILDLLVDETAYQASTPELEVSSMTSTPRSFDAVPITPVSTTPPTAWNGVFNIHPQVQGSPLNHSFSLDSQGYFVSQPLLETYPEQASFNLSTPSSSGELPITPTVTESPTACAAVYNTQLESQQVQDSPLYCSFPLGFQSSSVAQPLPDTRREQVVLNFSTSASSDPVLWNPYQNYLTQRPFDSGERHTLTRNTRLQALAPYTVAHQRHSTSLTSTTPPTVSSFGQFATEPSVNIDNIEPPMSSSAPAPTRSITPPTPSSFGEFATGPSVNVEPSSSAPVPTHSSPPIHHHSVAAALLLPPSLLTITCTYEGCIATFTGRNAWRKHLTKFHHISGNSTAGGVCRFPNCDKHQTSSIRRHILTEHSGVMLQCRQCPGQFARDDTLKRHVQRSKGHRYFEGRRDVFYSDEVCSA